MKTRVNHDVYLEYLISSAASSCKEDLVNLNALLVGKTVESVECTGASIAKFNMADGTSFSLVHTEWGMVIEQEES
jgi:hypothetical protein